MKRAAARLVFFVSLFLVVYCAMIWPLKQVSPEFFTQWSGAVSGALGALIATFGGRFFDRRWPKPKAGWAE